MGSFRKTLILSCAVGAFCVLTGCDITPEGLADYFGHDRTVPKDDDVDFSHRHPPELNPGTVQKMNNNNNGDDSGVYNASPTGSSQRSASLRRVPVENNATTNTAENYATPTAGRSVPMENPAAPSAAQSAPVAPVAMTSVPMAPAAVMPAAPVAGTTSMAASDATPIPPVAPAPVDASASGNSAYPALSGVPPVPAHTPKDQSTAEFNSLVSDRELSEAGRKNLLNNADATVMTSPQTGQLVDNAANATAPVPPVPVVPQQAAAAPEDFNNWLHGLSPAPAKASSQATAATVTTTPPAGLMAPAVATTTPTQNAVAAPAVAEAMPVPPVAPAQPASGITYTSAASPALGTQIGASEPINGVEVAPNIIVTKPTSEPAAPLAADVAAPVPQAAPTAPVVTLAPTTASIAPVPAAPFVPPVAPVAEVPPPPEALAQPAPAASAMEPVHLHPPASMAAEEQGSSPDMAQTDMPAADAPITLVPPQEASSQAHYLADSRYAARRMHVPADDDNSDSN